MLQYCVIYLLTSFTTETARKFGTLQQVVFDVGIKFDQFARTRKTK